MKPSFFSDCVKEKYGHETYEDEHGFFSYALTPERKLLVVEFYIKPESRPQIKIYLQYLKVIDKLAQSLQVSEVLMSILMSAKNNLKESTLLLALRAGFKLSHLENNNYIVLKRDVTCAGMRLVP